MTKSVNISSAHKAGRTTQVMMEHFADIAELANNKLIDKHIHVEHKAKYLHEVLDLLDKAVRKTDPLTKGKQLTKIMAQVENAAHKLNDYIVDMEKHSRW